MEIIAVGGRIRTVLVMSLSSWSLWKGLGSFEFWIRGLDGLVRPSMSRKMKYDEP
jgi:hypothetical protein